MEKQFKFGDFIIWVNDESDKYPFSLACKDKEHVKDTRYVLNHLTAWEMKLVYDCIGEHLREMGEL